MIATLIVLYVLAGTNAVGMTEAISQHALKRAVPTKELLATFIAWPVLTLFVIFAAVSGYLKGQPK